MNKMYLEKLKEMFNEMVVKKNAALIPVYYHPDFLLYTNGISQGYQTFLNDHIKYYASEIQYQVKYDTETFLEQGERVAGRIWITTKRPNEPVREIEVVLVVQYKDGKIYRVWELTYPDWSQMAAFKES